MPTSYDPNGPYAGYSSRAEMIAMNLVGRVDTVSQAAVSAISALNLAIGDQTLSMPTYVDPALPTTAPNAPTLTPLNLVIPDLPVLPDINVSSIPTPIFGDAPAPVSITLPARPTITLPAAPGAAPEFNAPAMPDAPLLTLPAVPTLDSLFVPPAPTVDYPEFTSTLPVTSLIAPSVVFDYEEQEYLSVLSDELNAKLIADLKNGGYGIDPADEQALWERAREREMRGGETAMQEASRQMAARGFNLPPGALAAQLGKIQVEVLSKVSDFSREVALKRADLFVQNRQFTIQQAAAVEQAMKQFFTQTMERTLNVARSNVEMHIALFNAAAAQHNLKLETYKAEAQVYAQQMQAAVARLEAYKTEIEGVRVSSEVQKDKVSIYTAQLQGVQLVAEVYRSRVEAAKAQADVERLKLEAYKAQIEGFTAQIGAATAEINIYDAQIKGETSKIQAYEAQVNAFQATVAAEKTKVEAASVATETQVKVVDAKVAAYRATLEGLVARIKMEETLIDAATKTFGSQVNIYSAQAQNTVAVANMRVEEYKAKVNAALEAARFKISNIVQEAGLNMEKAKALGQVDEGIAGVYGSMASSALNGAIGIEAAITTSTL